MVQINKPAIGPTIPYPTRRVGQCQMVNYTAAVKSQYISDKKKFTDPKKNWRPQQSVYGHPIVKELLKRDIQKNKCCYCEKEILSAYTVEHYRPCGAYSQDISGPSFKPGYYWLSYTWSNLFYSCTDCNNAKGTYFPLLNPKKRAKDHLNDELCKDEQPKLIDLVNEDPRKFIEYKLLEPFGIPGQNYLRGETMINAVGLRNENMLDERTAHWKFVLSVKENAERVINKLKGKDREEEIQIYNRFLDEKCHPDFPFSTLIASNRSYFELKL